MLYLPFSPDKGRVSSKQGVDGKISHFGYSYTGLDFSLDRHDRVLSMADGEIISIYNNAEDYTGQYTVYPNLDPLPGAEASLGSSGYGNYVTVEHVIQTADGEVRFYATYAHLEQDSMDGLKVGDPVEAGAELGEVGWTGLIRGDHLHIQVGVSLNGVLDPDDNEVYFYADGSKTPENDELINLLTFDHGGRGDTYAEIAGAYLSENGTLEDEPDTPPGIEIARDKAGDKAPDGKTPLDKSELDFNFDDIFEFEPDELIFDGNAYFGHINDNIDGFQFFDFAAMHVPSMTYNNSGYDDGLISGDWIAFNVLGRDAGILAEDSFDFLQATFTAAWIDNLELTITAFDREDTGWSARTSETIFLDTDDPIQWNFGADFQDIEALVFQTDGGRGYQFVMDDMIFAV